MYFFEAHLLYKPIHVHVKQELIIQGSIVTIVIVHVFITKDALAEMMPAKFSPGFLLFLCDMACMN